MPNPIDTSLYKTVSFLFYNHFGVIDHIYAFAQRDNHPFSCIYFYRGCMCSVERINVIFPSLSRKDADIPLNE